MENDQEFTEITDSNIGFIVPDSQLDDETSQQNLITGLSAYKLQHSFLGENLILDTHISSDTSMSGRNQRTYFHFSSTNESEAEDQGIPLAADTVSDTSDMSRHEADRNVTVIEGNIIKSDAKHTEGISCTSTPAQNVGSFQFSANPIIVTETVDSYDEVAPTPDAFGSVPMVIPDSPCMDDKDEEDEEDGVITFRPVYPTVDTDYQLTAHTSLEQSDNKAESQNLYLKLTPSQTDMLQISDAEEVTTDLIATENISAKEISSLNLGMGQTSVTESLPPFFLEKPTLADKQMESVEGSEESISVFRRVRTGNTTPQKQKLILDDSDEFLPAAGAISIKINEKKSPGNSLSKALQSRKSKRTFQDKLDDVDIIVKQAGSQKFSSKAESGLILIEKETVQAPKKVATVHKQRAPAGHAVHLGLNVSNDQSSQHLDQDLTLSYDYTGDQNSPYMSDQLIDVPAVDSCQSSVELENQVFSDPGLVIQPSQKCNTERQGKQENNVHYSEKFDCGETSKQTETSNNSTNVASVFENLPAQSVSISEKDCNKVEHSCNEIVLPVMCATKLKRETNLYQSQEEGNNNKDSCQFAERSNISDMHCSKADTGIYLDESTFVTHIGNNGELSVAGRTGGSSIAARDTSTSFSKGVIYSDSTTLRPSRSLDPYTFQDSQSQTIIGAPSLLKKSHVTVPQRKRPVVKRMKKVWRKRVRPNLEGHKSTSTDDTSKVNQPQKPRKSRRHFVRKKLTKSEKTKQPNPEQTQDQQKQQQQQDPERAVTEQTDFTSLQRKIKFNKPFDPPASKFGASSSLDLADAHAVKIQLNKKGHTKTEDITKQPKKSASVSFSGISHGEPSEVSRELSESSEHDIEKTKVQRILTAIVIITEKTTIEIYNSKGKLINQRESSVEVEKTILDPKVTSEKITERAITPQLSPSRSVSTVTTGDLADVSSSSLSRTYSSGSRVSNPSIDAVCSSLNLPTPAQRQHTLEGQDKEIPLQEGENQQDSDLLTGHGTNILTSNMNQKRLSVSSNTGQDLFSTPNQSIIDRADSRIGKVISSSNSTPDSQSLISPNAIINKPDYDGQTKTSLHPNVTISSESLTDNIARTAVITSLSEQQTQIAHRQKALSDEVVYDHKHSEVPQRQEHGKIIDGQRSIKSGNHYDDDDTGDEQLTLDSSSKIYSKKRKISHHDITYLKSGQLRKNARGKATMEKSKDDVGESADIQSTGFSVHGVPPSTASGDSVKDPATTVSSKSSAGYSFSPEISLQGGVVKSPTKMVILKDFKSKVVTGAKVMAKWKDGYFYPGVLSKVDQNNKKYMVKFCDGSQSVVKGSEIILARELPVGQSVMVLTSNDFYEPGMIMGHSELLEQEDSGNLVYHVERDDGVTQMCEKRNLILSEDQAECLLSDEEMRINLDALLPSAGKPGDISLDNLVDGKRQPRSAKSSSNKEDQPSTSGLQSASAHSSVSTAESEVYHSGRKRKIGPVATSTPTPKQVCKESRKKGSPLKKPIASPLSSVVVSPSSPHKAPRKARIGLLFESVTPKKSNLFEGIEFMLTHIEKSAEERVHENMLLEGSSLETSADDNPDVESETSPFVKEHLQSIIERGGGKVINSFDEVVLQSHKNCYMVAAEHQRTQKYLKALAAGMTIISHQWILHSAAQNKLQGLKAYILPAGISLEKKRLIEGTKSCSGLARQTVMVVSTNQEFIDIWTSILNIARSLVVTRFPARASKNDPGVDVVVSDSTCPSNIVKRCQQLDVPLVSSEWVAQCLITGHLVDTKGHEKYKHNHSI